MTIETITSLRDCPLTRAQAAAALGEEPIGFKAITESGPTCHLGCLAPGSSPHSHSTIVGWSIFGPTGGVDLNADLVALRSYSIHPFLS